MVGTLVIKSWSVDKKPIDDKRNFVRIVGRQGGLVSWFLSLIGIDPTTTILVGMDRLEFSSASLAGTAYRLIPLQSISSSYYGYHKPWSTAAAIIGVAVAVSGGLAQAAAQNGGGGGTAATVCVAVGLAIGIIYYLLNRTLTLGFVEVSGAVSGIKFKRSVIEGIDINDEKAKQVCTLVQQLIEQKQRSIMAPPPPRPPQAGV